MLMTWRLNMSFDVVSFWDVPYSLEKRYYVFTSNLKVSLWGIIIFLIFGGFALLNRGHLVFMHRVNKLKYGVARNIISIVQLHYLVPPLCAINAFSWFYFYSSYYCAQKHPNFRIISNLFPSRTHLVGTKLGNDILFLSHLLSHDKTQSQ